MAKVKSSTFTKSLPFSYSLTGSGPPIEISGDHGFSRDQEVYLGDSPQDWAYRRSIGRDATSELIGEYWSCRQTPVFYQAWGLKSPVLGQVHVRRGGVNPFVGAALTPGLSPQSRADAIAATALLNQYKDAVSSFRALDFTAEFIEALTFLTNPLRKIFKRTVGFARQVGSVKKLALTKPRSYAEKISNAYLAYQYAISPLVSDGRAASEAISELLAKSSEPFIRVISGSGSQVSKTDPGVTEASLDYVGYAYQSISACLLSQVRYRGKVGLSLAVPSDWAIYTGLTPPDVIPAVWEAIPFSFLIDYFTNVSEVLYRGSSASASPLVRYIVKGVKNTSEVSGSAFRFRTDHPDILDGYFRGVASGGSFLTRRVSVHRSSGVELPPVNLNFETPSYNAGINVLALITAVKASNPYR